MDPHCGTPRAQGRLGPRLMVAQPRRVAVHGLYRRALDEGLEDYVGMRMGHGVREGEQTTRLWCARAVG
eukprot:1434376-Prymnesium_polylepis.1